MNGSRPLQKDATARRGFTLVEVVIALAIFVFGALAIIRIFPPALGVIQNSGDRLVGNNLNRSLLARYDRSPELLPDAIYDPDRTRNSWQIDPTDTNPIYGSVAGSRRNRSIPTQPGLLGFNTSALNRYREVVGEKHILKQGNTFVYTQFPFPPTTNALRAYQEDSLTDVTVDENGVLDFSNAKIGSTGQAFTLSPPTTQDFLYVSYSWLEDGRFWSVDEEPFKYLPTGTNKVAQAGRMPTFVDKVVPGEVKFRLRKRLTLPAVVPATEAPDRANLGMVEVGGTAGTTVSFDYTVKDWRWLVVDSAPNAAPDDPPAPGVTPALPNQRMVNLPVRPLDKGADDFLFTVYPTQPVDQVNPANLIKPAFRSNRTAGLDEREVTQGGRVPFIVNPKIPKSPTSRVVYLTLDNWTQQLSVAASHYILYYDDTLTPQSVDNNFWRQCALSSTGKYLYFRPSEAGKTVLISYRYSTSAGDVTMDNQMLTIDTDIIDIPSDAPPGFAASEGMVSRLELVNNGNTIPGAVTAITKIDGIGIQSRVAWLDGDRFTQVSATRIRGGETQ